MLLQGTTGEVVHDQKGPGAVGPVGVAAVLDADDAGMIEPPQRLRLAEQLVDAAVEIVEQRLDHHRRLHVLVRTQKGDAEATRSQDALRSVLAEREGSEAAGVEAGGLEEFAEGCCPVAGLQGGARGVVVSLGLRPRLLDEAGQSGEVQLRRLEAARGHLQLADGIEQRRQLPLLLLGKGAVARPQVA